MGLSSKQVSSDVQDWNQALLQSGSSMELPKLPLKRQQEQDHQQPAELLKCPRCDSTNTKFCYYNNYNKSQPRHFCKACKRHWTNGGMLRNIPVGGGRKKKRPKTSAKTSSATAITTSKTAITTKKFATGADILPMAYLELLRPQSLHQDNLLNSSNSSSFNGIVGGSTALSPPQDHGLQFPCPSFTTFNDNVPCSFLASGYTSNPYGHRSGESSSLEETVLTGLDGPLSCSSLNDQPWPSVESTNIWDWGNIDKLITSDVTIPWDDSEIN